MDRTVTTASSLVLSAAQSFDEDVDYADNEKDNLEFSWACKCVCACLHAHLIIFRAWCMKLTYF